MTAQARAECEMMHLAPCLPSHHTHTAVRTSLVVAGEVGRVRTVHDP
jgi:hypothetical protein